MHTNSAAKIRSNRLEKLAREAITQYNDDMRKGGEPLFPDWALQLLGLIDDYERMLATLTKQRLHLVDVVDFETGVRGASVVQVQRVVS